MKMRKMNSGELTINYSKIGRPVTYTTLGKSLGEQTRIEFTYRAGPWRYKHGVKYKLKKKTDHCAFFNRCLVESSLGFMIIIVQEPDHGAACCSDDLDGVGTHHLLDMEGRIKAGISYLGRFQSAQHQFVVFLPPQLLGELL
mmetsp:Transcript_13420/g.53893  ORF Transcript_13420/g.53893 Transcript_13420/m.53893 type:complete len:142 (+) Transcript_13420:1736-2161(+)